MSNIQITVEKPVIQCIYRWIMYRLCNLGGWSRDRREEDGGRGLITQYSLRRPSPISLTITPSVTPMEALNNTTFYGICSAVSRREGMGYLIIWAFSVIMAWNVGRWPTMPCAWVDDEGTDDGTPPSRRGWGLNSIYVWRLHKTEGIYQLT